MSKSTRVTHIVCADIHLSHRPPVARAAEPDWYAAMARTLQQVRTIAQAHGAEVLIAGDIFDTYNPPPELINFALEQLPKCTAVPGQHDLPYHNAADIEKSAYGVLCRAGKIKNIDGKMTVNDPYIFGFGWGRGLYNQETLQTLGLVSVALIHRYCWISGKTHPGATNETYATEYATKLAGFDVAFFGDNHQGFALKSTKPQIYNCGTLMRRKFDEVDYKPSVYLLDSAGGVTHQYLDCSRDRFSDMSDSEIREISDMSDFLDELKKLGDAALNFREAVNMVLDSRGVSGSVRKIVLEALEAQ